MTSGNFQGKAVDGASFLRDFNGLSKKARPAKG